MTWPAAARSGLGRSASQPALSAAVVAVAVVLVVVGVRFGSHVFDSRTTWLAVAAFALAVGGALSARFAVVASVAALLFMALVRRLFPAVDPAADPAAITPFIVLLPLAARALARRQVPPAAAVALAVFAASAFRHPFAGVPALIALDVPILAGFAVRADAGLWHAFVRTWLVLAPLAFGYGLMQLFYVPPWDVTWLANADFNSVGQAGSLTFRPFATLPSAGAAALLAALTLSIVVTTFGRVRVPAPLRVVNIVVAIVFVAADGVRSAWLWGSVAVLVALLSGASKRVNLYLLPVILVGVVAVSQIPAIASKFADRAGSFSDLGADRSYQARSGLLSRAGGLLSVFGGGLGTNTNANGTAKAIDSGYLITLAELGIIGILALAALAYGVIRHVDRQFLAFPVFWLLANLTGYNWDNAAGFVVVAMTLVVPVAQRERPAGRNGELAVEHRRGSPLAAPPGNSGAGHGQTVIRV